MSFMKKTGKPKKESGKEAEKEPEKESGKEPEKGPEKEFGKEPEKELKKESKKEPETPQESIIFNALIPCNDLGKNASSDALNWALKEPKVNNIAITGYFGAGKSSLWESYKRDYATKDDVLGKTGVVEISLAKFSSKCENDFDYRVSSANEGLYDVKKTDEGYKVFSDAATSDYDRWKIYQEKKKRDESLEIEIERGILEQILYSVDSEDIPASQFKKIQELSGMNLVASTFVVFVLIVCGIVFAKFDDFSYMLEYSDSLYKIFHTESFYIWTLFLTVLFFCIMGVLPRLYSLRLSKISFHQVDIHFEENKGSLFSQNITELVYFFEKIDKRIVVFEDLDRFYSTLIFAKLRELNHILNESPVIRGSLKFVYMIRDDFFSKYERTKFFDFIVPIVPALTKDNAADFVKNRMPELVRDFSDSYVKDISIYLSDMRLLRNCENEYKVYKSVNEKVFGELNSTACEKIFTLILYKNLYPKDFQRLTKRDGFLYTVIRNCSEFIEENFKEEEK